MNFHAANQNYRFEIFEFTFKFYRFVFFVLEFFTVLKTKVMKKNTCFLWLFVAANGLLAQKSALHFDGINDYIPIKGTSALNGPAKITIETWLYVTNPYSSPCNNCAPLVWNQQNSYRFGTGNTRNVNFSILNGTTPVTLVSKGTLKDSVWHHIAATFNGTKLKLYIDGIATDSTTVSSFSISYASNAADIWIADPQTGYGGTLDETRIWDYARSDGEIKEGMIRRYPSNQSGLLLQLGYEDGSPYANNTGVTSIKDKTSYSHNGVPTNFALKDSSSNFVAGRVFCDTTIYSKFSITQCSKYLLPSKKKFVSNSGIYNDTIISYRGCDSVMTITVNILKTSSASVKLTGCDSVQNPVNKIYYKKSGNYQLTIRNYLGCDSNITFIVTVFPKDTTRLSYDVCNSITLSNGNTVTQSGVYVDSLKGKNGCDSFVIHTVKIRKSTPASVILKMCRFVLCPTNTAKVYRLPGIYFDTITNHAGCDSIIEYDVRSLATHGTSTILTCGSYKSPSGKYTWNSSGTYFDTLLFGNKVGCDSFLTIQLTLISTENKTINTEVCKHYITPSGTKVFTSSGIYTDVIKSAGGCDSIKYTINLTVINPVTSFNRTGNTLTAVNMVNGAAFQWMECSSQYLPITGETSKSFSPSGDGKYALEVTEKSCKDTSACINFVFNNLKIVSKPEFIIYPNPTQNEITVQSFHPNQKAKLKLMDILGNVILVRDLKTEKNTINIHIPAALYIIRIESEQGIEDHLLLVRN